MEAILIMAALGYLIYRSASDLSDKLSFSPTGFSLKKGILSLKISNASESSATVQNVTGSIFAGQTQIGTYIVRDRFTIPAFQAANINVKISLDKMAVLSAVASLLQKGSTPKISITGEIGTSLGRFPFENVIVEQSTLTA